MRLNQFLASCGLGSRRGCEALVRDGHVLVNGEVCTHLATRIGPGDEVEYGGRILQPKGEVTIAFHKPRGVLCTKSDEAGRETIYDILPREFRELRYVGRLDRESEGLLLLTTSGPLVHRLTHPKQKVEKEYLVTVDPKFDERDTAKLTAGIQLSDGLARAEAVVQVAPRQLALILTQGLKRQIRQMLSQLGYDVRRLQRTRLGSLTLGPLAPGKWRRLSHAEVEQIGAPGSFPSADRRA